MKNAIKGYFFEYETQKMVQIKSKQIGIAFRLIQFLIFVYFIGWIMIYEYGYQSTDKAISGVVAKIKGVSYINLTGSDSGIGERIFDVPDYVIPPTQNSAFFVMTNMVITTHQTQGECDESHDVYKISCKTDADCIKGEYVMLGSGIKTGRCVISSKTGNMSVCQIFGWCPTEHDTFPSNKNVITNAPNFTVLLKNSIEFPKYNVKRRNIPKSMSRKFVHTCNYEPNHPEKKYCPIFRLGDILKYADADTPDIWYKGGMVSINIDWKCNLDYSEEYCLPDYSFRRLDDANTPVAKGWNFRFGNYYRIKDVEYRELVKAYGIQFFITVYGTARKFDLYTVTMNIGSGLGLYGVATLVCDMIIFQLVKNRELYREASTDVVVKKKISPFNCPCSEVKGHSPEENKEKEEIKVLDDEEEEEEASV